MDTSPPSPLPSTPRRRLFRRKTHTPPGLQPNAEADAGILSRLVFHWIHPLILRGCALPLQEPDLPPLLPGDRAEYVAPIFHRSYRQIAAADFARAANRPRQNLAAASTSPVRDRQCSHRSAPSEPSRRLPGTTFDITNTSSNCPPGSTSSTTQPSTESDLHSTQANCGSSTACQSSHEIPQGHSVLERIAAAVPPRIAARTSRALFPVTGFPFLKAALWKPVWLIGAIGQVFAIRALVERVTEEASGDAIGSRWIYILVVLAMALCAILMSLSQHAVFAGSMRAGMRARAAISSEIYRKTLRLDPASLSKTSEGELGNLLVNDTQRILDSYSYFHFCWFGFIEIIVTSALLTIDLGVSAFFGVAFLLLLVPAQIFFSVLVSRARTRISKESDVRVQKMNEILSGIRIVKLSTWEPHFKSVVAGLRRREVRHLKVAAILRALNAALFFAAPVTVALATFTAHTLVFRRTLTPSIAFSSLAFFSVLSRVLTLMPLGWLATSEAGVASRRLDHFFNLPELPNLARSERLDVESILSSECNSEEETTDLDSESDNSADPGASQDSSPAARVFTKRAQFSYAKSDSRNEDGVAIALTNIDLSVADGELLSIVGPVGSGKSSLLLGLLGEIACTSGSVNRHGSVAYCAQQPWIVNGTVRENITLFGEDEEDFDKLWYEKVVDCCCLRPDMNTFPAGDRTEIGERGINLSGGQKARLALARAVYSRADIYLLDDPLSAVDAAVSGRLLNEVFGPKGLLADKTQIIVTHQLHLLPLSSQVVILGGGTIDDMGTFEELRSRGVEFSGFAGVEDDLDKERSEAAMDYDDMDSNGRSDGRQADSDLRELLKEADLDVSTDPGKPDNCEDTGKNKFLNVDILPKVQELEPEVVDGERLVADEDRRVGRVTASVYKAYISAAGGFTALIVVGACFAIAQAIRQGAEVWLGRWSTVAADVIEANPNANDLNNLIFRENRYHALVFLGLTLGTAVFTLLRAAIFAERCMVASRRLHDKLLERVLHATCSFFDANPVGRILNRFSKDVDQMDVMLPMTAQDFLQISFVALGALVTIGVILPWFLLSLVPIVALFIHLQRMYKMSSRELKRIDGVSRSPIYAQYVETTLGLSTVRAYRAQQNFTSHFNGRIDNNHRAYHMFACAGRWLGVRLDALTGLIVFFTSLIVLILSPSLDPGLAGVALTQSILMTGIFQWGVRQAAETENLFTSVERVANMATETPIEKPYEISDQRPPEDWPSQGVVCFDNAVLKYRPELDPALQNLSFKTRARERVGIVGRTGSGKSSLFVCLFRMVELTQGTVSIDGRDISEMGLHDLRSRMAIVPQDPVLFNGTIRENLDPTGIHDDVTLWDALHRVHMSSAIRGITGSVNGEGHGLDLIVHEKGSNFSAGERQLLSLARAILSGVKVVVLDEASASLDNHTDMLIQKTVREQLSDRTVLTIAHRLATIADSDRVLVVDAGEVVEFDSPARLMERRGYFARLVEETGKIESAILKAIIVEASGTSSGKALPEEA